MKRIGLLICIAAAVVGLMQGCARPQPKQDDALRSRPTAPQRERDRTEQKPHFAGNSRGRPSAVACEIG